MKQTATYLQMIELSALKQQLCTAFCSDVQMASAGDAIAVALPLDGRDGDSIVAYVTPITAGFRVSDKGTTLMRLSYENDLGQLMSGARKELFETLLSESGLQIDDGEIFLDVAPGDIAKGLFSLGRGLVRAEDMGLWSTSRIASTFYDDLQRIIGEIVPADALKQDYEIPGIPDAESYPVDFFIQTKGRPLYLFGVNNSAKARLATIILQHLSAAKHSFESLIVCSNIDEIGKKDRNRLMNAANDIVPTIADSAAIRHKIEHRLAS